MSINWKILIQAIINLKKIKVIRKKQLTFQTLLKNQFKQLQNKKNKIKISGSK